MICKTCAKAADVAEGRTIALISFKPDPRPALEIAMELHAACKGGTWCDCHHRIKPDVVVYNPLIRHASVTICSERS